FGNNVMRKLGRQFNLESEIASVFPKSDDRRGAIDVALHEVPAHAPVQNKRALEIDRTFAPRCFQICAIDCFLKKIESELLATMRAQGQTAAIGGDAVSGAHLLINTRRGDLKLRPFVRR